MFSITGSAKGQMRLVMGRSEDSSKKEARDTTPEGDRYLLNLKPFFFLIVFFHDFRIVPLVKLGHVGRATSVRDVFAGLVVVALVIDVAVVDAVGLLVLDPSIGMACSACAVDVRQTRLGAVER